MDLDEVAGKKIEEVSPLIKRRIQRLARKYGVKVDFKASPADSYQWDGRKISAKGQMVSCIVHDIAHYLACPTERRDVPDFGLGVGPDSGANYAPELKSDPNAVEEEIDASALGMALEYSIGIDPMWTYRFHNWDESSADTGTADLLVRVDKFLKSNVISARLVGSFSRYLTKKASGPQRRSLLTS